MGEAAILAGVQVAISAAATIATALLTRNNRPPANDLDKISIGGAEYGVPIPIPYSLYRVPGNVVWWGGVTSRPIPTPGKGGLFSANSQAPREYFADLAVAYSGASLGAYLKVFMGNNPIYDELTDDGEAVRIDRLEFRRYFGETGEPVDPLILDYFEGDAVRARQSIPEGMAYLVFEQLPLSEFGNVVPPSSAIVATQATPTAGISIGYTGSDAATRASLWLRNERLVVVHDGSADELIAYRDTRDEVVARIDLGFVRSFAAQYSALQAADLTGSVYLYGVEGPYVMLAIETDPTLPSVWVALSRTDLTPVYAICDTAVARARGYQVTIDQDQMKLDGPFSLETQAFARAFPFSRTATTARVIEATRTRWMLIGGNSEGTNFLTSDGDLWVMDITAGNYLAGIDLVKPSSKLLALTVGAETEQFTDVWYLEASGFDIDYPAPFLGRLRLLPLCRYDPALGQTIGVTQEHRLLQLPTAGVRDMARMTYDPTDGGLYIHNNGSVLKYDTRNAGETAESPIPPTLAWNLSVSGGGATNAYAGAVDARMDRVDGINWGINVGGFSTVTISVRDPATGAEVETFTAAQNGPGAATSSGGQNWWDPDLQRHGGADVAVAQSQGTGWQYSDRSIGAGIDLQTLVEDVWRRLGAPAAKLDASALSGLIVDGFALTELTDGRGALQQLAQVFDFDFVERSGQLVAVPRGGGIVRPIPESDLIPPPDRADWRLDTRASALQVPQRVAFSYASPALDYGQATQDYPTTFTDDPSLDRPLTQRVGVAMTDQVAANVAARLYEIARAERDQVEPFRLPTAYSDLEPGDVISLGGRVLRIDRVTKGADLTVEVQAARARVYASAPLPTPTPAVPQATGVNAIPDAAVLTPVFIDALVEPVSVVSTDAAYTVGGGRGAAETAAYTGASPRVSVPAEGIDRSATEVIASETMIASIVEAPAPLQTPNAYYPVEDSVVVQVTRRADLLSTVSDFRFRNLEQLGVLITTDGVCEVIAYRDVTDLGEGRYRLSRLIRGINDSGGPGARAYLGGRFVVLNRASLSTLVLPLQAIGDSATVTAPAGQRPLNGRVAPELAVTLTHQSLLAPRPVRIGRSDDGSGITLTWFRQTRAAAPLVDGVDDASLMEAFESYEVDVRDGAGSVVRTLSTTTESVVYAAADVATDLGATPERLDVEVFQIGGGGRGRGARRALIDGETI